ncbi:Hypothetical protein SMAX5B_014163 [Scophthalmus maximus]|uniref:Uncharacterized protein n=1 Tax=Scophthalmus maximus TaxID=52904 RepID=A0A2U9BH67_SCOMX|nr:Hypothetical protein SMAX5B_014163 [Scophthalmus maximus]
MRLHTAEANVSQRLTPLPQLRAFALSSALGKGLRHSPLVPAVEAAVYFGKAESTQEKLSFTLHRVHLACCRLYCKPLQCSSDVGIKTLEIQQLVSNDEAGFVSLVSINDTVPEIQQVTSYSKSAPLATWLYDCREVTMADTLLHWSVP